jgi:D-alanyl-D-alanine carboxypeptidase
MYAPVTAILASILFVLAPNPASAQAQEGPQLQAMLDSARSSMGANGAVAAVVFRDGTMWSGASGIASPGQPVTTQTAFELGSITKTYTAAAVLGLVAEGRLSLDDRLDRWYPDVTGADRITLAMLLNHTHGLHDPSQEADFVPAILRTPGREWTAEDLFERMAEPHFEPGSEWRYSNTGYHLLGRIAERITGHSMARLVRDMLLTPLGREETWYAASEPVAGASAAAYIDVSGSGTALPVSRMIPWTAFLTSAGAAGSVVASAPDAAMWLHALATGRVLPDSAWTRMTSWVDRPDGNRHGLGLLRLEGAERPLIGHKGNSAGFSAAVFHEPTSGITVAVLTNAHAVDVTPVVIALLERAAAQAHRP